jgi:protein-L-isoaspartate O-methyltransferase
VNLDAIYAAHPVSERNILARLARQGVPLSGLTEWSLAVDPDTDITDQNHPGGVQSVLELAAAARISPASTVIDVGAGIGGSARVLAQAFGCRVIAVEQDSERCQQAARLTALVGLSQRVRCLQLDALSSEPDLKDANVLWGQSAWAHFPSPDPFLDLWLPALTPSGRVAVSDAFLLRVPDAQEDVELVRELETLWAVHLVPADRWLRALEARRCQTVHDRDHAEVARAHFTHMLAVSSMWPPGTVTAEEKRGWIVAVEALERRLITFCTLVAEKSG